MATEDRTQRLINIRDNLEKELEDELTERREAQARGEGVKTDYSFGGRSVQWNAYLAAMTARIRELNDLLQSQDPFEIHVRMY